jgi:hypothetical protein
VTIATPGQSKLVTFSGTADQQINLNITNVTFPYCGVVVSILNPDGTTMATTVSAGCINPPNAFLGPLTLPQTGTYTILVAPSGSDTGGLTLTMTYAGSVAVSVSPASSTLHASQTQQFTTTVAGTNNTGVTWSISPSVGSISSEGLYTAPTSITTTQTVTVTATSFSNTSQSAAATVTLSP